MSSRENWERLVAAVLKREQLWQLCHEDSRSPSISTISSDFSGQILSFSSNSLEPISVSPPPQIPLSKPSVSQVSKNATRPFTQKLFAAWSRRRKAKGKYVDDFPGEEDLGLHLGRVRIFSLHELQVATENFRDKNVLEYGYNMVYKGWLSDGSPVAVKRHKDRGAQGAEVQFLTEVEINSFAWHPNLLHMLGFCTASNERLTVYPLLANGSVASYLRGRNESQPPLNWSVRKKIAWGAARGLAFLHDKCVPPVIHRDVKAANIYLDEDFEAVVGDFDLAVIMGDNVTHASETCSEKTDVYGYGTFLLELVSGHRAFELAGLASEDGMILLDWIRRNLEERKWEMMADPYCGGNHMEEVVEQLTKIALLCTQSTPLRRPKMSEIVRMLEVGDALAERWEECSKEEIICQKDLGIHLRRVRRFSLHELQVATGNFSDKINPENAQNVVFKGWLADGFAVAVKRHKARNDRTAEQQSLTEVDIGRITAHPNVLHVLGFCVTPKDQLVVYPLMVNGSVKSRLRDRHDSQAPLAWPIRKGIALGAARGLAYLHEECFHKIIHRDVKAANILLNEDFEAVIADFELAIIMDHDDTVFEDTVCGTLGHIAPEYLSTGRCSEKTDVFGYGMFLLELITGQRAYDRARLANDEDVMLLDWVKSNYKEIKWEMMVDSDLEGNYIDEEVEQLMLTALICTQRRPDKRPKMSEVVRILEAGDGLAERWEEWHEEEIKTENDSSELEKKNDSSYYITVDDTSFNSLDYELSAPR